MTGSLQIDRVRAEMSAPYPAGSLSPSELGDTLAQLVWESFSEFAGDPEYERHRNLLGIETEEGLPARPVAEELLVFHLWAHVRAVQLSFVGVPDEFVRESLDHLHRAVFDDIVAGGTPSSQIPVFEQRVSARYAEYYAAAEVSDGRVGEVAAEHLAEAGATESERGAGVMTARAIEIAHPLKDFLEGVELVEDPQSDQVRDQATSESAG